MIILGPLLTIIDVALSLYMWAVIISAVLSWLITFNVINTSNRVVYTIVDFLWRITEPALKPIRRLMNQYLPNMGGIDISPIALILLIYFARLVLFEINRSLRAVGL